VDSQTANRDRERQARALTRGARSPPRCAVCREAPHRHRSSFR